MVFRWGLGRQSLYQDHLEKFCKPHMSLYTTSYFRLKITTKEGTIWALGQWCAGKYLITGSQKNKVP